MKDLKNYKKHVEVDMKRYSGNFHFNEQLKQEGTDIKINEQTVQTIDGIEKPIRAIVRNHGNEYNELKEERSIMIDKKYDYKVGDYVEYLDDIYLTNASVDKDNPFFNTTKMTRCNNVLKWMEDGVLIEQPCIVYNNTKYTGGTKTSNSITEVDAMVNITIQANENTKKIGYGKRLYTMKNAWRVTLVDDITTQNVFSWTLGKDSLNNEIDDIENGICDAFLYSYAISLSSTSESIQVGETYQINAEVTNNGELVSNPNITYTSSDENIATVNENGLVTSLTEGNCIIMVSIGSVIANLSLIVNPKIIENITSYSCDWSMGTTFQTYVASTAQCNIYINGIKQDGLVISYDIDSIGQSLVNNGKIAITQPSNSSIQIRNKSVSTTTTFTINIKDSSDGTLIKSQVITLTGM